MMTLSPNEHLVFVALIQISTAAKIGLAGVGAAVIGRRFRYGSMPRAAEWAAVLMLVSTSLSFMPSLGDLIEGVGRIFGLPGYRTNKFTLPWLCAQLAVALVALAGLGLARSPWLGKGGGTRTLVGAVAMAILAWGPLRSFFPSLSRLLYMMANLFLPAPEGFSPAWATIGEHGSWAPHALPRLILLVMSIRSAVGRGWTAWRWTEWAGATCLAWWAVHMVLVRYGFAMRYQPSPWDFICLAFFLAISVPIVLRLEKIPWLVDQARSPTNPRGI
jgi:hypothetical protein